LISLREGDVRHIVKKISIRGTTLFQTSSQSEVCTQSYMAPKSWESQLREFRDSRDKMPFGCGPRGKALNIYYKGEGGGFPQVRVVVNLMNLNLSMVCPNTKNAQTMHLPTCCLVCVGPSEWLKCLSIFLVPSRSSNMPLTPLRPPSTESQGVCPNFLFFWCFHLKLTFEIIEEVGSASNMP
jgi:hypothetical protein